MAARGSPAAGYSKRSLVEKLGIKSGQRVAILHAPSDYVALLAPLPNQVVWLEELGEELDFIQFFTTSCQELAVRFPQLKASLAYKGMLWISWPKRTAKMPTDLDENIIRELGLMHELVDVKVAAIDQTWSGLKFVYRLKDRPK